MIKVSLDEISLTRIKLVYIVFSTKSRKQYMKLPLRLILFACVTEKEPEDFLFSLLKKTSEQFLRTLKFSTSLKFKKIYQSLRIQRNELLRHIL